MVGVVICIRYTSTPMDENPVDDKEKGLPTFDYSEVDDYDSGDDTEQVFFFFYVFVYVIFFYFDSHSGSSQRM